MEETILNGNTYKFQNNKINEESILLNHRPYSAEYVGIFKKQGISPFRDAVVVDPKLRAVLIFTAVALLFYKIFVLSMSYVTIDNFNNVTKSIQHYIENTWLWITKEENSSKILSILCGVGFAVFSWALVYLDSNIPGVHPPSPFSPNSKRRYRRQKSSSIHLGYITALASGIVVAVLLCFDF